MSGWKSQVRWEISQVKGKLSLTTIKQTIHSNEPQLWLLIKATIPKNKNKIKNYYIHALAGPLKVSGKLPCMPLLALNAFKSLQD